MITKRVYEEFFRTRQFRRTDGKGWLGATETISGAVVKVYEKELGTDTSATMVSDVSVDASTKVKYKLKAGTAGKFYRVVFQITTSAGLKYQDELELKVT